MYATNPLEGNAYGGIPPAKPIPQWKELQTARQRIGLMLVAHAKAQPQALLPHLADLANKTQELWAAGVIGTNEQSTLFDVVLAAASGADLQLQKQVPKFICKPTMPSTCDANWQWIVLLLVMQRCVDTVRRALCCSGNCHMHQCIFTCPALLPWTCPGQVVGDVPY